MLSPRVEPRPGADGDANPGSFDIYLQLLRAEHDELRRECARLHAQARGAQAAEAPGRASIAGSSQQDVIYEEACRGADGGAWEESEDQEDGEQPGSPNSGTTGVENSFRTMLAALGGDTGASHATRKKVNEIVNKAKTRSFGGSRSAPGLFPFRGAHDLKRKLKWVRDNRFSLAVSFIIILNALYMIVQTSVVLHNTRQDTSSQMSVIWICVDVVFAAIFTSELVLRVFAYQVKFYNGSQKWWNLFDCLTWLATLIALASDIAKAPPDFFVNFLKLLRLARLVRSLKASKARRLHVLKTLMYTVAGSANAFLSAILLLVIVVSVFGVMFMQGLQNYIQTPDYRQDTRRHLERYFGTFGDTSYTLVACITGGINWDDIVPSLGEIGVLYHWFLVAYIMFAVLCVLNILNGVFVTAAIESAKSNKELAVESTSHQRHALVKEMVRWFREADKDGSGKVSWEELRDIMHNDEVRHLLLASGIDVTSAGQIFLLLDRDKSGDLEPEEFVDNLMALQGNAQALDMASLRMVCDETSTKVREIETALGSHVRSLGRRDSKNSNPSGARPRYPRLGSNSQALSPREAAAHDLGPNLTPADDMSV